MRIECTLMAVAAFAGFSMGQAPAEPPMQMPKTEPKPKVMPDLPHKIFVGEWEIVQYLRPTVASAPLPKGLIELKDDLTYTWKTAQGDTIAGKFQVFDQKIVLTRKTPLGETFTYNLIHLDIVDGKVVRPIGANCYEEWTRLPQKPKN